jgi:hypothetical protein
MLTKDEHGALRALQAGEATPYQQTQALHVIVNKFSRSHDVLFIPGSRDESSFLSGRGFVGQNILKYLKLPVGRLPTLDPKEEEEENSHV